MKIYFFIAIIFFCLIACQNQGNEKKHLSATFKDTSSFTTIHWIDSLKDIGFVEAGAKTEIKFKFRNTGSKPLFVISAEPGCGCTVADYPKEPLAPGSEGMITAAYNATAGTTGEFRKNIHVTTNTFGSQSHNIYFYGAIKNPGDSVASKKLDTLKLSKRITNELKKNLLLKPIKN
jgi:hypothetical protein